MMSMLTYLFSIHKLTKPSAFEVSKLDQCRTVIDLYEQVDLDSHRRLKQFHEHYFSNSLLSDFDLQVEKHRISIFIV